MSRSCASSSRRFCRSARARSAASVGAALIRAWIGRTQSPQEPKAERIPRPRGGAAGPARHAEKPASPRRQLAKSGLRTGGAVKFCCTFSFVQPDHFLELAQVAESHGWDTVMLSDHVVHQETIRSKYPYSEVGE